MQTTSKISTISYNNDEFLKDTLNSLVEGGVVEWWVYITHKAEKDGEKEHKHLILQPSKKVDTSKLRNMFNEIVPGMDKPLGVMPFQKSKDFANWYYYALHNKTFISAKGKTKKYEYQKKDLVASDDLVLENLIDEITPTRDMVEEVVFEKIMENPYCNWSKVFKDSGLPFNKWKMMRENLNYAINDDYKETPRGQGFEMVSEDDEGDNPFTS